VSERIAMWKLLWVRLQKGGHQRNALHRLAMLLNQVGAVSKVISYRVACPEHTDGRNAELKVALADLFAQVNILILSEGLSLEEIESLSQRKLQEFIETRLPKAGGDENA